MLRVVVVVVSLNSIDMLETVVKVNKRDEKGNKNKKEEVMKKILPVVLCLLFFGLASVMVSTTAYATNGMNMEGYGPIATGMGGASMAYDNGTAAMMNNPATLGLMPEGNRLDVALGYLGPHVKATDDVDSFSTTPGASSTSHANAFFMPALGWVQKTGQVSYGIGVFSQGGMGAKYSGDSFLAYGSGNEVRSELGVGRVLIPFAYEVSKDFSVGATLDFVWASLDLKMALNGAQFADLVGPSFGGSNTYGTASGSLINSLLPAFGAGQLTGLNWARFDFADQSSFTGAAKGTGFAGKIGGVYKINDALSLGATYHSKTSLGDLETNGATLSMNVVGPATGGQNVTIPVNGNIKIKDFQWPQMFGAGLAYQATPQLMVVFDYKWINWKAVMKSFKMSFTADASQEDPTASAFGLGGQSMDAELTQNWKDQNVFMIGLGYKIDADWTIRGGVNYANNPIPDQYLNALFPAIEKTHIMVGAGYMITKASSVDFSFTYAPEVKQTSGLNAPEGATVTHNQTNSQIMYSYRF
jgi:long-chain fatty acid transport protein